MCRIIDNVLVIYTNGCGNKLFIFLFLFLFLYNSHITVGGGGGGVGQRRNLIPGYIRVGTGPRCPNGAVPIQAIYKRIIVGFYRNVGK